LPRIHGSAISIASSSFAFKQMPLRLWLQADATATTNRYHCGDKQMPLWLQADATAAINRCHCGYKQMPLRLHTVNKTTDRPNIRHHSCPTTSHILYLYSRSSSPRRSNDPSGVHLDVQLSARQLFCFALRPVLPFLRRKLCRDVRSSNRTNWRQLPHRRHRCPLRVLPRRRLQMHHPQRLLPDNVRHVMVLAPAMAPLRSLDPDLHSDPRSDPQSLR
jgi:hypothetical protein